MEFVYRPDEGEEQRFEIRLGKLRSIDTEAIERVTGMDWQEFQERLGRQNSTCARALLWILQRRKHPTLKYADVDLAPDEWDVEPDAGELDQAREAIESHPTLSDEQRREQLAIIDALRKNAPAGEGKAPGKSGGTTTSGRSPKSSTSG